MIALITKQCLNFEVRFDIFCARFAEYFRPAMFYHFDRDHKGCIAIVPFFSYVVRRVRLQQFKILISIYKNVLL